MPCYDARLRSGMGLDASVSETLHEIVHLLVDTADGALHDERRGVGDSLFDAQHVEELVGGEQDVRKFVQHALGHRKMNGVDRVGGEFGFQGHSTQE